YSAAPAPVCFTLSLHDALPISAGVGGVLGQFGGDDQLVFADIVLGVVALEEPAAAQGHQPRIGVGDVAHRAGAFLRDGLALPLRDRKSTRLNSSHLVISYAVFC